MNGARCEMFTGLYQEREQAFLKIKLRKGTKIIHANLTFELSDL